MNKQMTHIDITLGGFFKKWGVGRIERYYDESESENVKGFYVFAWPMMLRVTWAA